MNDKNVKSIKLFLTVVIIGMIVWFIFIFPLIKFKKMESDVLNATKRYFEINESKLPKGNSSRKVSLDMLYKYDFIINDLKAPYTNKYCNSDESWGRVIKNGSSYDYSVYLDCGVFKSRVDHKGPNVKLNGSDEVIIYQGDEYKDEGIKNVVDDTDGVIDKEKVVIDTSKVDTSKVGTYEVTYTISDSLDNKTVKVRKVIVTQTLNNIVEKATDNSNIYKGVNDNNYLMIDGIMFKIVGINSDKTVKVVSKDALASVNYDGIDSWLNDYFYEKLSDSAKEHIYKKSKWCIENVSNPTNYNSCKKYSRKKIVGMLSIADYNNSKDNKNISSIVNDSPIWLSNSFSNDKYYINSYFNMVDGGLKEYKEVSKEEIYNVKPVINIIENSIIISGDGSFYNPYILKDNANTNKKGDKISSTKTGTYISYSGYTWRVIGKDSDDTTEVILMDPVETTEGTYYTNYADELDYYNPNEKLTLAGNIVNILPSYVKTSYFVNKNITIKQYKDKVLYKKQSSEKKYKVKFNEMSIFDLYSAKSSSSSTVWYQEVSKANNQVYFNSPTNGIDKEKFDYDTKYSVRVVGYLNKNVVIKNGSGTIDNPYTITK